MDKLSKSLSQTDLSFIKNLLIEIDNLPKKEEIKKEDIKEEVKEVVKLSNKCSVCKKKVPLASQFKCGCDEMKMYCANHRYPEEHQCTKEKEKVKLEKVVGEKIVKI